jgi:surfeit locus 1 family protein
MAAKGAAPDIPVAALLLCAALFSALGVWQVNGWHGKALIAHDEASTAAGRGADAPMVPSKGGTGGSGISPRLGLAALNAGHHAGAALTDRGAGYWVLTPLRMADGRAVWINRGYVPLGSTAQSIAASTPGRSGHHRPAAQDRTGGGSFRPMSRRRTAGIRAMSPPWPRHAASGNAAWFIDAQGLKLPGNRCRADRGAIPEQHLQYALTWFAWRWPACSASGWSVGAAPDKARPWHHNRHAWPTLTSPRPPWQHGLLVQLRWIAVLGQLVTIWVAWRVGRQAALAELVAVPALLALMNVAHGPMGGNARAIPIWNCWAR